MCLNMLKKFSLYKLKKKEILAFKNTENKIFSDIWPSPKNRISGKAYDGPSHLFYLFADAVWK